MYRKVYKTCNCCKKSKHLSLFHKDSKGFLGVRSVCKSCRNEKRKNYYKKNKK